MSQSNPQHLQQLKQIQTFLSTHENYTTNTQYFKSEIQTHSNPTILALALTINHILRDDDYDPYCKLLAMRFLRESWACASYGMSTLVNSVMGDVLFEVAGYRRAVKEEERGQEMFLGYRSGKYEELYVRRLGLSFHKIVLEMYEAMSQVLPYCPYNEAPHRTPSIFTSHYKQLKQLNTTFPSTKTYYKPSLIQKLSTLYTEQSSKQQAHIREFYRYLLSQLEHKDLYLEYKAILLAIVDSGDQYCVGCIVGYIEGVGMGQDQGEGLGERWDWVDFVDGVVATADVQAVEALGRRLLPKILGMYKNRRIGEEDMGKVASWGRMMSQVPDPEFDYEGYSKISKVFSSRRSKQTDLSKAQHFRQKWQKMRNNNQIKFQTLSKDKSHLEQIDRLLAQLQKEQEIKVYEIKIDKSQELPVEKTRDRVKEEKKEEEPVEKPIEKSKSPVKQIVEDPTFTFDLVPQRQQFAQILSTPKAKISSRFFLSTSKRKSLAGSEYRNNEPSEQSNNGSVFSLNPSVKNRNTRGISHESNRLSKSSQLQLLEKGYLTSLPSVQGRKRKEVLDQYGCSGCEMPVPVSVTSVQSLYHEIQQGKRKERLLEQQLQRKQQLIKKLQAQKNPQTLKIPASKLAIEQQPYKWRKHLLKKKVLVFENSLFEVGLITKVIDNIMECSLFFTVFTELRDVYVRINTRSKWLTNCSAKPEYKDRIKTESQYIFKIKLLCSANFGPNPTLTDPKPELQLTFLNQHLKTTATHKIDLPIHINKICENHETSMQEYKTNKTSPGKNAPKVGEWSELIRIDNKVCKNFDYFAKYFPRAIILDDSKTFVALLQGLKCWFYLEIKLMKKNEAILRVTGKKDRPADEQLLETFFKIFKQLFST